MCWYLVNTILVCMDSPHAVFTILKVVLSLGIQRLLAVFYAMAFSSAQDTLTMPISLYLFPSVSTSLWN